MQAAGNNMCRYAAGIFFLFASGLCLHGCTEEQPSTTSSTSEGSEPVVETRAIPMPLDLDTADPLIAELINTTSEQVRLNPANAMAWARHASALMANAYYEPSIEASRIALGMEPSRLPLLYRQAMSLWRLNRQDEAIADLELVLETEPKYDPGWRTLASWRLERGEIEQAEVAARRAWELAPQRPGTVLVLARVLLQDDRPDEAIALLEPELARPNAPAWLHSIAAQAYRRLGRTEEFEASSAVAKPPPTRWPDPWLNEIAMLATGRRMLALNALDMLRLRGPREAMPLLERALEADPANNDVRAGVAYALEQRGMVNKSLKVLDGIEPGSTPTLNYWKQYAMTCIGMSRMGQKETWIPRALSAMQEAIEIEETGELHQKAASIALSINAEGQAAAHFYRSAELSFEAGDLNAAATQLEAALRLLPEDRHNLVLQARIFIETGREGDARMILEELLVSDPDDAEAGALLQQVSAPGAP